MADLPTLTPDIECDLFGHEDEGDGVCWCGMVTYGLAPDESSESQA